jgi:hypothetical protein
MRYCCLIFDSHLTRVCAHLLEKAQQANGVVVLRALNATMLTKSS